MLRRLQPSLASALYRARRARERGDWPRGNYA